VIEYELKVTRGVAAACAASSPVPMSNYNARARE